MSNLCLKFVFVCLSLLEFVSTDEPQKLDLKVFYESKCPDSKAFISKQLIPAISLLENRVRLKLVPFGKARSINNDPTSFECQHGETECLGNLVQDCALSYMKDRSDIEKLQYVECEMTTLAGTHGDLMCVNKANVPEESVRHCVSSEEGIMLQLESESLTNLFNHSFIPTIIMVDRFDQEDQDNAQEDLIGVLCSKLEATPCAGCYNHQALEYVLS